MCLSAGACSHSSNGKVNEICAALEEKCGGQQAEDERYEEMVDSKYDIRDIQDDFKDGFYTIVKKSDFKFFGYHAVTDTSKVKSVFRYLKTDPTLSNEDVVPIMEVLLIQFDSQDAAKNYYETIQTFRKQNYENIQQMNLDYFNEFVSKKDYFAYAYETDGMTFNVYAQIDGKVVMYAFIEGPTSEKLKAEYIAFMKEMKCSIITQ